MREKVALVFNAIWVTKGRIPEKTEVREGFTPNPLPLFVAPGN